jgi:hypothetical protein
MMSSSSKNYHVVDLLCFATLGYTLLVEHLYWTICIITLFDFRAGPWGFLESCLKDTRKRFW